MITIKLEQKIIDMYKNDIPTRIISKNTGISMPKVKNIIYKNGMKPRSNIKITASNKIKICKLYNNGMTLINIANKLNIAPSTVYICLKNSNVVLKNTCHAEAYIMTDEDYISGKNHNQRRKDKLYWNILNPCILDYINNINMERHHVNFNNVIYIPKNCHREVVHNLQTGYNMEIINTISYFFLVMNYIDELNKIFIK